MKRVTLRSKNLLFIASFLLSSLYIKAEIFPFTNTYSGSQEVPANGSTGTGTISGTYNDETKMLSYTIVFSGLLANTTAAHFHAPGAIGVSVGIMIHHTGFPTGVRAGTFSSSHLLNAEQELHLLNGLVYSNIHTSAFPPGEIRAQIILAPRITCPANIVTSTDAGACTALESFTATATGLSISAISYWLNGTTIASPYSFPKGTSTIAARVTNAGGTSECSFNVTVNDTEKPVITGMSATPDELWPPNGKMRDVLVSYTTSDNCGGVITCGLTVSSNEGTSADWRIIDAHNIQLRARREGKGNGRVYTITATCSDASGNVSLPATTTVTVPHDMGNRNEAGGTNREDKLSVNVLSNPSSTYFSLNIQSLDKNGLMNIRIVDLAGTLVESKNNLRHDQQIRVGESLKPGIYMLQVRQGQTTEQLKLIKQ